MFGALGAGHLILGSSSAAFAQARQGASPRGAFPRPFNIVTFGDSIMWGQGLRQEQKFRTLVRDYISFRMPGREVRVFNFARSGAIIGGDWTVAGEDTFGEPSGNEVPDSHPTLHGQLRRSKDKLGGAIRPQPAEASAQVDLILVDGGANDVNMLNILNPAKTDGDIRAFTKTAVRRMSGFLAALLTEFPNAKVVVTGYYQIISKETSPQDLGLLLGALGLTGGVALAGGAGAAVSAVAVSPVIFSSVRNGAYAFYDEVTTGLRQVVIDHANRPLGRGRIAFVDPMFTSFNAYAARDTYLFRVFENDPMVAQRENACRQRPAGLSDLKCLRASMGHPNARGARAYADAITMWVNEWFFGGDPALAAARARAEAQHQAQLRIQQEQLLREESDAARVHRIEQRTNPTGREQRAPRGDP